MQEHRHERKVESPKYIYPQPPITHSSPRLLPPPPLPPAPRPRPGHLGPHPLRGLGSGSCSARLPRGDLGPKAAAGAAGAWPSGLSGVGPWGHLGRERRQGRGGGGGGGEAGGRRGAGRDAGRCLGNESCREAGEGRVQACSMGGPGAFGGDKGITSTGTRRVKRCSGSDLLGRGAGSAGPRQLFLSVSSPQPSPQTESPPRLFRTPCTPPRPRARFPGPPALSASPQRPPSPRAGAKKGRK